MGCLQSAVKELRGRHASTMGQNGQMSELEAHVIKTMDATNLT